MNPTHKIIHDDARCPWCNSTQRAVRLDVPGFRHGCYNDWHFPKCKNCGCGKYSHGHEWGCQRYEAMEVEQVAA